MRWIGVDVAGQSKGFDIAVIDDTTLVALHGRLTCGGVVEIVAKVAPRLVAIDSPRSCAPDGEKTRECERKIATRVCGIRWTSDAMAVRASGYYGWIVEGLKLYAALELVGADVIEVFPTASWTRWLGKRGSQRRSAWTRYGLESWALAVSRIGPTRTSETRPQPLSQHATTPTV